MTCEHSCPNFSGEERGKRGKHQDMAILQCGHMFCRRCIIDATSDFTTNLICPFCRESMLGQSCQSYQVSQNDVKRIMSDKEAADGMVIADPVGDLYVDAIYIYNKNLLANAKAEKPRRKLLGCFGLF